MVKAEMHLTEQLHENFDNFSANTSDVSPILYFILHDISNIISKWGHIRAIPSWRKVIFYLMPTDNHD